MRLNWMYNHLIFILLLSLPYTVFSQNMMRNMVSAAQLDKGKTYCDKLDLNQVDKENTFIYCKAVYTQKHDYREALKVITIAQKKLPYSYEIRLEKALALSNLGGTKDATEELIGLIHLYPNKFELHNILARLQYGKDRTKSLMPFIISVIIDPNNPKAEENITFIKHLLQPTKMEWEIDKSMGKLLIPTGDNNFDFVQYQLRKSDKRPIINDTSFLINRLELLCTALEETPSIKKGFFWDYYANYLIELKQKNQIKNIVFHITQSSDIERSKFYLENNLVF